MLSPRDIEQILFLDTETAPVVSSYDELSPRMQALWAKKAQRIDAEADPATLFFEKAGIYAEFARVVCVSLGNVRWVPGAPAPEIRLKSFGGENEEVILNMLKESLNRFFGSGPQRFLCAHNGKEFDFPFLGRRYLINHIPLPAALEVQGKKPWETPFLDTMDLWKFGDRKDYTSLDLLTAVLDIPSPKDDIDGSQVGRIFWEEKDYDRIIQYCQKDVIATAQVVLRMNFHPLIPEEQA